MRDYEGGGGGAKTPKKDYVIYEQPLTSFKIFHWTLLLLENRTITFPDFKIDSNLYLFIRKMENI